MSWTHKKRRTTTSNIRISDKKKHWNWQKTHKQKKLKKLIRADTVFEHNNNYKHNLKQEQSWRMRTEQDLFRLITEEDLFRLITEDNEEVVINDKELNEEQEYLPPVLHIDDQHLDITNCNTINWIDPKYRSSMDPKFVAAFRNYIKIRLYNTSLSGTNSLGPLLAALNIYNKIMNNKNPIELGGTSAATLSRLQQFQTVNLFRSEICILLHRMWQDGHSTMTLHYDETSQNDESQFSMVMSFNVDANETELLNENIFILRLRAGNIVRAIWHNNIPAKDATNTMKWAVKPAMELLNKMSYELYNSWTSIKSLINGTIGTMTDQNANALAINKLIAKYLDAAQLIESICLMHNIYNSITPALNRLTMERIQLNQDKELLRNTMNLDILCIANRIQNVLNVKNESIRNKGEIFEQYEAKYEGGTNSEFGRVIGDRKINQLKNVHAILSRRKCNKEFSQMQHNETYIIKCKSLL